MPIGSILTDGTHSYMTTSAQPVANITGWNTGTLSITPPADYNGMLTLQLTATAAESVGGSSASVSQTLTVAVDAIAQVPTLTLTPPAGSVSRSLPATRWEGADPTDSGADQHWLELSNGVGTRHESPSIAQSIHTLAGAQYTFSFNYAGQAGLTSAHTQIGVYLDGSLLGTYSNVSGDSPNWQTLHYSFKGDGAAHTLSVRLVNGTDTGTARGAMLDALSLIETLPQSASTVYGFAGSPIALPQISDQPAANDPGQLITSLLGLPAGAIVSDGKNSLTLQNDDTPLNLTGWNLNSLTLSVPNDPETENSHDNHRHTLNLQVIATSVEPANGSMARIAQNITVQWLSGQACVTPVGVNPYVSYINPPTISQILKPHSNPIVVASPLVPVSSSYPATALLSQWTAYSDLNPASDPDDDPIKIKPVMDWSAHPDDFLFDDGASAWSDTGSSASWLTGFLGTDKATSQDAASLCNLSVRLGQDSSESL